MCLGLTPYVRRTFADGPTLTHDRFENKMVYRWNRFHLKEGLFTVVGQIMLGFFMHPSKPEVKRVRIGGRKY